MKPKSYWKLSPAPLGGNDRTGPVVPVVKKRSVAVWAAAANAPLKVCSDARYHGEDPSPSLYNSSTPAGSQPDGAIGFDWGIGFNSFADLVNTLTTSKIPAHTCGNRFTDCPPLQNGELLELAINAHGAPGRVDIDCHSTRGDLFFEATGEVACLDIDSLSTYSAQFDALNKLLAPEGVLFFMCCLTGQLQAGTAFLQAVSKLLPGRDIMAISTIGYSLGDKQMRSSAGCNEPGMRDTAEVFASNSQAREEQIFTPIWNDLNELPWAGRSSPHTKVARDGAIVGGRGISM